MVTVADAFQVPLGLTGSVVSIAFVRLREVNALGVLGLVVIDQNVAFVVVALTNEPAEDASGVIWIDDPAFSCLSIPSSNVVLGNRAPGNIRRICGISPALDTREEPFDAGAVTIDAVLDIVYS